MEYGVSKNDETPIEFGQWVFVVGEAEPWISPTALSTGCALWKQGPRGEARNLPISPGNSGVHPQHGAGSIRSGDRKKPACKGPFAHLAIWNRLLSGDEIASIWSAGASDLASLPSVPQLRMTGSTRRSRSAAFAIDPVARSISPNDRLTSTPAGLRKYRPSPTAWRTGKIDPKQAFPSLAL